MTELILALIGAALINNIVLQQTLAVDPPLRMDPGADRAKVHALGLATLIAMPVVSTSSQLLVQYGLRPLQLDYLHLFVLLPLCVLGAAPLLRGLQRCCKAWPFDGLAPLLTGNAALLGLCLQLDAEQRGIVYSLVTGLGSGLGFWLVLALFDDLRQRTRHEDVPVIFRGLPVELISAGIMAMAFLGFSGLFAS